jgi:hypothetical protein
LAVPPKQIETLTARRLLLFTCTASVDSIFANPLQAVKNATGKALDLERSTSPGLIELERSSKKGHKLTLLMRLEILARHNLARCNNIPDLLLMEGTHY